MRKLFKNWFFPAIIAGLLFIVVRPVLAQTVESPTGEITVGTSIGRDNYRQIYYDQDGTRTLITDSSYSNANPQVDGDIIVWMAELNGHWQIFTYNVSSSTTIQITYSGNNVNPQIKNGLIVWEGWTNQDIYEDTWQIYIYTKGIKKQLTSGDMAINPYIEGNNIIYARRGVDGWRAETYSVSNNKSIFITNSPNAKHPRLSKGEIYLGKEKFALMIDDLYLLGFDQSAEEVAGFATESAELTTQDIIEELVSSPSAEAIVLQIPESTESASVED